MAIYDALYELGVRTYREEILPILQPLNDPWEILQALLENFMTLSIQNPELFQIVFERPIPGFVPSEASMTETRRMLRDTFLQLNRVIPEQEYDFEQYVPVTHGLMMAMMQGLTAAHLANDPGVPEGSGRFAALIPGAVELFKTAWGQAASLPSSAMDQEK
jgi:hypothetical protein